MKFSSIVHLSQSEQAGRAGAECVQGGGICALFGAGLSMNRFRGDDSYSSVARELSWNL